MQKLKLAFSVSLIFLAIAGCVVTTKQLSPQPAIPDDIVWQLDLIISSGKQSEITHLKPQFQFKSEEQEFIGNDGCNSICASIEYSIEDGLFKVSGLSQTALACSIGIRDENGNVIETIEAHNRGIAEILSAVESYELNDKELRLQSGKSQVLVFHPTSGPLFYKGSCVYLEKTE